ncbi:endolytic transglycosylase MltG [Nakamurella leprariae]|uniref:Endolytic murein transglycosylase n=1 Tax=Nakamurella leprariae TaxID=2803911 RepID=A0A939C1B9_9ACTN|nr:endolytic transglycosylase MltG [Nakamurella leprariae]MBM9466989.1 endolytic transglycosylase MltG [Nakamurella leprariae]
MTGDRPTPRHDREMDLERLRAVLAGSHAQGGAGAPPRPGDGHQDPHPESRTDASRDSDADPHQEPHHDPHGDPHADDPHPVLALGGATAATRRRRSRSRSTVIAVLVLVTIVAGLFVGFRIWRDDATSTADWAGTGDTWTVVRVQGGDGLTDIADTLTAAQVVASPDAFLAVAGTDADVKALQPGYYKVRQHASAQAAADDLVAADNRVGEVRLVPGRQLADVTVPGADPVAGYISQITAAACVQLDGADPADCFTTDELWEVARTADPVELGVPSWAVEAVQTSPDPARRLEGLILPGDYNIAPGSTALEALRSVISGSQAGWYGTDLADRAAALGTTPYDLVVMASVVEREGIVADMPEVARVIVNRLAVPMKLEMDSTVNYALDRAQIATSAADRANPSPWNTYWADGLPPTPISSPGPDALAAAMDPLPGPWLFFVKIDETGASCFSVTVQEHEACVERARANGVFG